MLPERAEVLVVGGGVIGLTVARELVARGRSGVVVLEKEPDLGRHASGRNSGVLHAGIYYAPDSAKARTCLAGNRLMRAYCREKALPLVEGGKVIVARDASELPTLEELHRRATANGARVRFVDEQELAALEPMARTVERALHSLDTAVVDPKAVLRSLRADLEAAGVTAILKAWFEAYKGPGEIQDREVLLATFSRWVLKKQPNRDWALRAQAELKAGSQKLVDAYLVQADKLLDLWPLPTHPQAGRSTRRRKPAGSPRGNASVAADASRKQQSANT